jgi:hypothetical protein
MVAWIALLTFLIGTGAGIRIGPPPGTGSAHLAQSHPVIRPMDGTSGGPS